MIHLRLPVLMTNNTAVYRKDRLYAPIVSKLCLLHLRYNVIVVFNSFDYLYLFNK